MRMMGLPPVVVGLAVYLLLSRSGPLGSMGILFTPTAMVIAQTILIVPIIAALTRQTIEDLWAEYRDELTAMDVSQAGRMATLLWDARFSLLTALLAGFGRAAAEVGAVMIVGGNIDGFTRTMTTAVALETSKGNLPLAMGLGLVLVAIVLAINAAAWGTRALVRTAGGLTMRATVSDLPLVLDGVSLQAGATTILDRLSLAITPGAPTLIVGPNGSGKTSLLRLLHGACGAHGGPRQLGRPDREQAGAARHPVSASGDAAPNRRRQCRLCAGAGRHAAQRARGACRGIAGARRACPTWRSARRENSRAANSSGWRWPARWRAIRKSCCSTSPPPASIPPRRAASRRSC